MPQEQFVSGMEASKPDASTTTAAASETATELVDQLMAAINTCRNASQRTSASSALSAAA